MLIYAGGGIAKWFNAVDCKSTIREFNSLSPHGVSPRQVRRWFLIPVTRGFDPYYSKDICHVYKLGPAGFEPV